jgi:hypothetical protein
VTWQRRLQHVAAEAVLEERLGRLAATAHDDLAASARRESAPDGPESPAFLA